jgi:hypothetical protein
MSIFGLIGAPSETTSLPADESVTGILQKVRMLSLTAAGS